MRHTRHSDRHRTWPAAAMIAVLAVLAAPLSAVVIPLSTAATVDDLFAGPAAPAGGLMIEAVSASTFDVSVYSQAYSDGKDFAYLYQLANDAGSPDPLEMFTVSPFIGADAAVDMGYLTGAVPPGFLAADQEPEDDGPSEAFSVRLSTGRATVTLPHGATGADLAALVRAILNRKK